ncbi:hypothetical protein IAR55_000756 [Kwoniella newhampshirensis]|uniref:Protein FRA10AC1 n=1 Tax=Kwoniella newhampshirensis TaxID=1651941 RepID=A0AAW0Z3T1_9TREE
MSWKTAPGRLHSGPPTLSSSTSTSGDTPVGLRLRPNSHSYNAYQRETLLSTYSNPSATLAELEKKKKSEWDVVRENHRFIRDDEEPEAVTWEERVARAYESKLFKEFALIDLKHYKSKKLALRWRTAPEVINGIGEDTCGSLRCKWHEQPPQIVHSPGIRFDGYGVGGGHSTTSFGLDRDDREGDEGRGGGGGRGGGRRRRGKEREREREMPLLKSFELPFVYSEAGERKEALVKVRLCPKCVLKLVWKPGMDGHSTEEQDDGRGKDRGAVDREESRGLKGGERRRKSESRSRSPQWRRHRDRDQDGVGR